MTVIIYPLQKRTSEPLKLPTDLFYTLNTKDSLLMNAPTLIQLNPAEPEKCQYRYSGLELVTSVLLSSHWGNSGFQASCSTGITQNQGLIKQNTADC